MNRKQDYLIIAGLLILLSPFLALLRFVFPLGDDFFLAMMINEQGFWSYVSHMYMHWSGRFAAIFIDAADPWCFHSLSAYRLTLAFFFLFNIFSVFILLKALFKPQYPKHKLLIYSLMFYVVVLNAIPDVFEYLYWYPAVAAYQWGLSLLFLFVAHHLFYLAGRLPAFWYGLLNASIAFVLTGLSELYFVPMVFSVAIGIVAALKNKINIKPILLVLGFLVVSVALLVLAPGNYERMPDSNPASILTGFYIAAKSLVLLLGYLFQNPSFVLGSLLFVAFVSDPKVQQSLIPDAVLKLRPLWVIGLALVLTYLIFLPSALALSSLPAGRILNIAAFIFAAGFAYSLAVFQRYYSPQWNFVLPPLYKKVMLFALILSLFSGIYITNPYEFAHKKPGSVLINGNVLGATSTLIFEARDYAAAMQQRFGALEKASRQHRKTLSLPPLEHHPKMLIFVDMSYIEKPGTWLVDWQTKYYGLDSLYIEKKAPKKP